MPIDFEPAQPLDVNVASAYGANQSFQQALPTIAELYEAGGRLQQQGQQAAADRNARGQEAIAGLSLHANQFNAQQQQAAQRDLFESTRGFEMQQQRTELAAWLNNQELSQKEQMRLQAMTNAVSDVTQNPDLSGEEKQNLVMKLKTGIDVYRGRQERAQAQMQEAHAKQFLSQADLVTKSEVEAAKNAKTAAEQGMTTMVHRDPHSGISELWFYDPGKKVWYNPSTTAGGAKGTAPKPEPVGRYGDPVTGEFSYAKVRKDAVAEAEFAYPVKKQKVGEQTVDVNAEKRAEYMQQIAEREKAKHYGVTGSGAQPAGQEGGAEKPDPAAKIDTAIEDAKQRKDMLPVQREKLIGAMTALKQIVAVYPDIRTAPPQVQQQAQAAAQFIASVPPPRPVTENTSGQGGKRPIVGNVINPNPPPPAPAEKSWWQKNVVDNIPDLPGI